MLLSKTIEKCYIVTSVRSVAMPTPSWFNKVVIDTLVEALKIGAQKYAQKFNEIPKTPLRIELGAKQQDGRKAADLDR